MLNGDGWTLGSSTSGEIRDGRPLTDDERARIPAALARMQEFSGNALIGPLIDALNAVTAVLDELATVTPFEFEHGQYRSRLNGALSAVLTQFTGLRSTVETSAGTLGLPLGSSAPANFRALHESHHAYRLIWMLRNIEQHYRPAASAITISKDSDPRTGEKRTRPMIDVPALCERYSREAAPRFRHQWRELRELWEGQPASVDLRWALHDAFEASHTVVAMYFREAEPLIVDDARYIARLVAEVEPFGSACAVRTESDPADPKTISIYMQHLDPTIFGNALATLDGARKILNEPPLDLGSVAG